MEYQLARLIGGTVAVPLLVAFLVWLFIFAPRSEWVRRMGEPTAETAARPRTAEGGRTEDVLAVGALIFTIAILAGMVVLWAQGSGVDLSSLIEKGPQ